MSDDDAVADGGGASGVLNGALDDVSDHAGRSAQRQRCCVPALSLPACAPLGDQRFQRDGLTPEAVVEIVVGAEEHTCDYSGLCG